jgi:ribosomal protein S18 acetylase RimI-like enzyme
LVDEGVSVLGRVERKMAGQVTIRPGKAADLPQVTGLWQQLVRYHVECDDRVPPVASGGAEKWQRRLKQLLADPTCRLYVAEAGRDEPLVGFATGFLQYAPEVFEPQLAGKVADIFVLPHWRRQRVGHRLLAALTAWFESESVDHIELNVVDSNPSAVGFWHGIGAQGFTRRLWLPMDWQNWIGEREPQ